MRYDAKDPRCSYGENKAKKILREPENPLYGSDTISGRELQKRYADLLFGSPITTNIMHLIMFVHVATVLNQNTGALQPVVSQDWIDTVFDVANDIWSQACIKLLPFYWYKKLVTEPEFRDFALSGSLDCLIPGSVEDKIAEKYDATGGIISR